MPSIDRLVFFGTPAMAVPALAALCDVGREPLLVVTQPARGAGRGHHLRQPPVADWALERGLEVAQPERVRDSGFVARLKALDPDVAVVVAFGQIFPQALLDVPSCGCINLHASLLPRHRGAAPVQAAIAAGDQITGVTTMLMERSLDTGPILMAEKVAIGSRDSAAHLAQKLADAGARLILETLIELEAGVLEPRRQRDAGATYAPVLTREDGVIDWSSTAAEIERRLRAFTPWPGISTTFAGESIKVLEVEVRDRGVEAPEPPGTILAVRPDGLWIACGNGTVLTIDRLQRPGKSSVGGRDFANGLRLAPGDRFV
jgi:methionyl-tRNA formyltransferase